MTELAMPARSVGMDQSLFIKFALRDGYPSGHSGYSIANGTYWRHATVIHSSHKV
jgi:hypothetical protein